MNSGGNAPASKSLRWRSASCSFRAGRSTPHAEIEENTTWEWDQAKYDELQATVGDLGAPTMFMPRMNVQSLYIEKMGVERGIYALYDWTDSAEAYFRALEESEDRAN